MIYQLVSHHYQWIIVILFVCLSIFYNIFDFAEIGLSFLKWPNAIGEICVSYPFFLLGTLFKPFSEYLNKATPPICWTLFFTTIVVVFICGYYNGMVSMYAGGYGRNILLFYLGGFAGTIMLYSVSKLSKGFNGYIQTLSSGTIIILGFHNLVIYVIRQYFPNPSLWDFLWAALVTLLFVPVIIASQRYFPYLIGRMRVSK